MKHRITITNLSPRSRATWTDQIAVPWAKDLPTIATVISDDGRRFSGARGEDVGTHSATYRFWGDFAGSETITGTVVDSPGTAVAFVAHPWVMDDLRATVPLVTYLASDGRILQPDVPLALQEISSSPAHKRFYYRMAIAELGIVQECYVDILRDDPVLKVWGCVTWSDRRDPQRLKTFPGVLGLASGEQLALDFAGPHGWRYSEAAINGEVRKTVLFGRDQTFIDGGSIPFTGSILCYRGPQTPTQWKPDDGDDVQIGWLRAAQGGPVVGVCHDWDGRWLAHQNTPRRARHDSLALAPVANVGLLAIRPLGCAPYPGQTGDQEDFAAQKGSTEVTFLQTAEMRLLRYSVQAEHFRGQRHFEPDGSPLDPSRHPNWVTWGMRTLYALWDASPDATLGKQGGYWPAPPGGWEGYDDEHRSQNNLAAHIALTGDPLAITQWMNCTTIDVASYTHKSGSVGPMRAEGRLAHVWANMALLLEGEAGRRACALLDHRVSLWKSHWGLQVPGGMKVLAFHEPDLRKPIYDSSNVLAKTVTMWELGLLLNGVYAALKSGVVTDLPGLQAVLGTLCRTMANYGCYVGNDGKWRVVSDVVYENGNDVDLRLAEQYQPGKFHVAIADTNAGDVRSWTMVGLLIAREVLRIPDPGLAAKLDQCIAAMGVDLNNPPDQRQAEWWAAVRT